MEAEKTKLEKRVAGIKGMVANLIVDQQAMATSFNTRGDRHSGSLDRHRSTLTALGRFQEKTGKHQHFGGRVPEPPYPGREPWG